MAQFTVYRSIDSGAPILSGAQGSLTGVLTAVLVNGYGNQSGAGWTLSFSTTTGNAVYRQGSGSLFYFRIDDTGPDGGSFREARLIGCESMSGVYSGTNFFPAAGQGVNSAGMVIARKSATLDTTQRGWVIVADAATCYCFINSEATGTYASTFAFGDIYSFVSGDSYKGFVIGRNSSNSTATSDERFGNMCATTTTLTASFLARSYNGASLSIPFGKHGESVKGGGVNVNVGALQYPNPADSGIYLSPTWITETTPSLRGYLRGIYHWCHQFASAGDGDTFSGMGLYSGKSFLFLRNFTSSTNTQVTVIETSNTVLAN